MPSATATDSATFTVQVLGVPIAVDCDPESIDEDLRSEWRRLWEPCHTEATPRLRVWASLAPDTEIPQGYAYFVRAEDPRQLAAQLSDVVIGTALAELVPVDARSGRLTELPEMVGVRAAAVARGDRAVLLVGGGPREHTLRALATHYDHLSDAAVAVRLDDGLVIGAPKPLTTYPEPELSSRREVALDDAGLQPTGGQVRLAAIAFLDPIAGAHPDWSPVSIPSAVAKLAAIVPIFVAFPRPAQDLARVVALTRGAVSLTYGDVEELPALLDEVLAADIDEPLVIPTESGPGPDTVPQPGDIRRNTMLDGITDGTTMALCSKDRKVVAIAGIAPYLWDHTRDWISLDALTERVIAALGIPDDADPRGLVDAAVTALVEEKVLIRLA